MAETKEKTVADVFNEFTEEQKTVVYALIGQALEDAGVDEDEKGDEEMKQNVFYSDEAQPENVLTHADQTAILELAQRPGYTFKSALKEDTEGNELAHSGVFETADLEALLPDYKNLNPGAPEIVREDQSWVMKVINKVHKSPFPRVRTRHADARSAELKAKGYNNREEQKKLQDTIKLIQRSFDPQTIYVKDELNRDDIVDITDFDVVAYQRNIMKHNLEEDIALAALVGDGREDTDPDKFIAQMGAEAIEKLL